jgi:predicted ATPase
VLGVLAHRPRTPDVLELPETTAELVFKRVDALDAQSRRLLGIAAAIGATFAPDLVADVCEVDRQRVLDVVTDAAWHRLVEPRADGRHAFLHDRIREALLGQFDEPARRRLHDRIADILARRDDRDPERVYALAHHRASGSPDHDAVGMFHTCHAAGRLAMADHAPESALHFLEHAIAAAVRAGIVTDSAFGRLLGTAYHQAARLDDAIDALQRTVSTATEPVERAQSLHLMARVYESAWNTADQVKASEQALAELGRSLPRNRRCSAAPTSACTAPSRTGATRSSSITDGQCAVRAQRPERVDVNSDEAANRSSGQ